MAPTRLTLRFNGPSRTRLDELLRERLPALVSGREKAVRDDSDPAMSNSKIRRLIVSGAVSVNGRRETRPAAEVRQGATLSIAYDPELFAREKKPDDVRCEIGPESVIYEDGLIIAVNKPAGIPTEATVVGSRDHLHAAVARYLARSAGGPAAPDAPGGALPYVGLHHRLDRETSGIILFTKDPSANPAVHALFHDRLAKKAYLALASLPAVNPARRSGSYALRKKGDSLTVENLLARVSPKSARARWGAVDAGGVEAKTEFTLLDSARGAACLRCEPFTGRTHQIRVHLAGLGMPILGDALYGGSETDPLGQKIPRVMLHAAELVFPHPQDGRQMRLTAPLPADFEALLAALGLGSR